MLESIWSTVFAYVANNVTDLLTEPGLGRLFWVIKPARRQWGLSNALPLLCTVAQAGQEKMFRWLCHQCEAEGLLQPLNYVLLGRLCLLQQKIPEFIVLFEHMLLIKRQRYMQGFLEWALVSVERSLWICEYLYATEPVQLTHDLFRALLDTHDEPFLAWFLLHTSGFTLVDLLVARQLLKNTKLVEQNQVFRQSFRPAYRFYTDEHLLRYWLSVIRMLRHRGAWICKTAQPPHLLLRSPDPQSTFHRRITLGHCTDEAGQSQLYWNERSLDHLILPTDLLLYVSREYERHLAHVQEPNATTEDTVDAMPPLIDDKDEPLLTPEYVDRLCNTPLEIDAKP